MKKNYWIGIVILFIIIGGFLFFIFKNDNSKKIANENTSNYETARSSTSSNSSTSLNDISTNSSTEKNVIVVKENATSNEDIPPTEEEISSFSTKIYSKKDANRQNNLSITCSKLNNTEVAPGSTFSFCNTIRKIYCPKRL